jgi:hypothetical protein
MHHPNLQSKALRKGCLKPPITRSGELFIKKAGLFHAWPTATLKPPPNSLPSSVINRLVREKIAMALKIVKIQWLMLIFSIEVAIVPHFQTRPDEGFL